MLVYLNKCTLESLLWTKGTKKLRKIGSRVNRFYVCIYELEFQKRRKENRAIIILKDVRTQNFPILIKDITPSF